jgi:hypothetical protein
MQAKQLKASVYQDPGVAVTGSSRTRTSGTTRDRAQILKKDLELGIKAQRWVETASLRDPEIGLRTLASVQGTH